MPPHPNHTPYSLPARRRRPPRDGVRRNTSHELAHTRKHSSQVCRSRPRTAFALSKNDEGYTYTDRRTDRQTDRQTNLIMAPCTHPGMKRVFAFRQKTALVASLPGPCLITRREVNEARRHHTCSRPCAFEEINKNKSTKSRAIFQ